MKVVHIAPTYFDESSVIGGGERYPTELSSWMSKLVDTTLVSFSTRRQTYRQDRLKIELYPVKQFIHGNKVNPLAFRYVQSLRGADVVHIHHIHTLVSDLGCLAGSVLGKRVFVTDYGGGGSLTLNRRLPVFPAYQNAIAYSQFGLEMLPAGLKEKAILIRGGIDIGKFCPNGIGSREKKILYVGRILPHKGIDYLIAGFRLLNRTDYRLRILGRVQNGTYLRDLRQLAMGLSVDFIHDADDQRLVNEYRTARVTVLPSVHTTSDGMYTSVPELMGFTLLESQACGTPVVCTNAGAMPEFVDDNSTGIVVPQNSASAIAAALRETIHWEEPLRQKRCREWVEGLNWESVAARHVAAYNC